MSDSKYTLEREYKVYDDVNGAKLVVKPDGDGLGLIEIDGGDDYGRLVLSSELAGIVAHAILHCVEDMEFLQKKVEAKLKKEEAPTANEEEWIAHDGKGMPVDEYTCVAARFRSGREDLRATAKFWNEGSESWWIHKNSENDIIAYKIINQ